MYSILGDLDSKEEKTRLAGLKKLAQVDLKSNAGMIDKLKDIFQHDVSRLVRISAAEICLTYNAYREEVSGCLKEIYDRFGKHPLISKALERNYFVNRARENLHSEHESVRLEAAKNLHNASFFPNLEEALSQMLTDTSQLVRINIAKAVLRHWPHEEGRKAAWHVILLASKHTNAYVRNAALQMMVVTHKDYVDLCGHVKSVSLEENKKWPLPKDWEIAQDHTWLGKRPPDFYPINLYCHPWKKQAVLAFSSTIVTAETTVWADVKLFLKTQSIPIRDTFPEIYKKIKAALGAEYSLQVTGFSLGASMAAAFSCDFDIPAVVFDSPGSASLIPAEKRAHQKIQSFLSAPSPINTLQEHVGSIYRLVLAPDDHLYNPKLSQFSSLTIRMIQTLQCLPDCIPVEAVVIWAALLDYIAHGLSWIKEQQNWSYYQHSLTAIRDIIDEATETFTTDSCIRMKKWPTRTSYLFNPSFLEALKTQARKESLSEMTVYKLFDLGMLPDYVPDQKGGR
jgi:hypothetical protein